MPNDFRDRPRWRDDEGDIERDRERYWRGERNRGMFGYEGEGYMRGGGRDVERDTWRRDSGGGFRRAAYGDYRGPVGMDEGYDDLESDRSRGYRSGMRGEGGSAAFSQEMPASRQSFRGRGPKNYNRSDERIMEEVCERLTNDDYVDASDMEVQVSGGVVTLSGTVHERNDKRRAEDIAESVGGVREVQNHLRIGRDASASLGGAGRENRER